MPYKNQIPCTVEGCQKAIVARGLCRTHYGRWRRHGTTTREQVTPEERFWKYVNKDGPIHPVLGRCWEWTGAKIRDGYGHITVCSQSGKRSLKTHRFSWELHNGPIPDGQVVMHGCDNPSCVNPAHLSVGTNAENIADRDQKGRTHKGELHYQTHLTEEQVREIRRRYVPDSADSGSTALAREFGTSHQTILRIVKRVVWKHVI